MNNEMIQIQNKITELENERKKIDSELLSTQKQLVENQDFLEQQRLKELTTVEAKLKERYPKLLKLAWTEIPEFLSKSYSAIELLSQEYSQMQAEELALLQDVKFLQKEYVRLGGDGKIWYGLRKEAGEPVEVCEGYKAILTALACNSRNSGLWTQRPGVVLNFLDQSRRDPRKDF